MAIKSLFYKHWSEPEKKLQFDTNLGLESQVRRKHKEEFNWGPD